MPANVRQVDSSAQGMCNFAELQSGRSSATTQWNSAQQAARRQGREEDSAIRRLQQRSATAGVTARRRHEMNDEEQPAAEPPVDSDAAAIPHDVLPPFTSHPNAHDRGGESEVPMSQVAHDNMELAQAGGLHRLTRTIDWGRTDVDVFERTSVLPRFVVAVLPRGVSHSTPFSVPFRYRSVEDEFLRFEYARQRRLLTWASIIGIIVSAFTLATQSSHTGPLVLAAMILVTSMISLCVEIGIALTAQPMHQHISAALSHARAAEVNQVFFYGVASGLLSFGAYLFVATCPETLRGVNFGESDEEREQLCFDSLESRLLIPLAVATLQGRPRLQFFLPIVLGNYVLLCLGRFVEPVDSSSVAAVKLVAVAVALCILLVIHRQNEVSKRHAFQEYAVFQSRAETAARRSKALRDFVDEMLPPVMRNRLLGFRTLLDVSESGSCVVVDVANFSQFTFSYLPQEAATCIATLAAFCSEQAQVAGIDRVRSVGDRFIAVANLMTIAEDHASRCARFGLLLYTAVAYSPMLAGRGLALRCAMHSGQLLGGVVGETHIRYDLFGAAHVVASAALPICPPGMIICTAESHALVAQVGDIVVEPAKALSPLGAAVEICVSCLTTNTAHAVYLILGMRVPQPAAHHAPHSMAPASAEQQLLDTDSTSGFTMPDDDHLVEVGSRFVASAADMSGGGVENPSPSQTAGSHHHLPRSPSSFSPAHPVPPQHGPGLAAPPPTQLADPLPPPENPMGGRTSESHATSNNCDTETGQQCCTHGNRVVGEGFTDEELTLFAARRIVNQKVLDDYSTATSLKLQQRELEAESTLRFRSPHQEAAFVRHKRDIDLSLLVVNAGCQEVLAVLLFIITFSSPLPSFNGTHHREVGVVILAVASFMGIATILVTNAERRARAQKRQQLRDWEDAGTTFEQPSKSFRVNSNDGAKGQHTLAWSYTDPLLIEGNNRHRLIAAVVAFHINQWLLPLALVLTRPTVATGNIAFVFVILALSSYAVLPFRYATPHFVLMSSWGLASGFVGGIGLQPSTLLVLPMLCVAAIYKEFLREASQRATFHDIALTQHAVETIAHEEQVRACVLQGRIPPPVQRRAATNRCSGQFITWALSDLVVMGLRFDDLETALFTAAKNGSAEALVALIRDSTGQAESVIRIVCQTIAVISAFGDSFLLAGPLMDGNEVDVQASACEVALLIDALGDPGEFLANRQLTRKVSRTALSSRDSINSYGSSIRERMGADGSFGGGTVGGFRAVVHSPLVEAEVFQSQTTSDGGGSLSAAGRDLPSIAQTVTHVVPGTSSERLSPIAPSIPPSNPVNSTRGADGSARRTMTITAAIGHATCVLTASEYPTFDVFGIALSMVRSMLTGCPITGGAFATEKLVRMATRELSQIPQRPAHTSASDSATATGGFAEQPPSPSVTAAAPRSRLSYLHDLVQQTRRRGIQFGQAETWSMRGLGQLRVCSVLPYAVQQQMRKVPCAATSTTGSARESSLSASQGSPPQKYRVDGSDFVPIPPILSHGLETLDSRPGNSP